MFTFSMHRTWGCVGGFQGRRCHIVVGVLIGRICFVFVVRGESLGCRLFGTASMLVEWLRNLLPHHSQGNSTERCSRNNLRVVTAS